MAEQIILAGEPLSDDPSEWMPAQIEAMLPKAIRKGDAEFIKAALTLLALKDPRRADVLLETMELGFMLAKERDRG